MPSAEDTPRPPKKARTEDGGIAADVTPPDESETKKSFRACRFRVSNRKCSFKDFNVLLLIEKHGLYDVVNTVFRHELTRLSGGDQVYSHMWKLSFHGNEYVNFQLTPNSNVCDLENPRSFRELNLKRGQKGSFHGESGQFQFTVEDTYCQDVTPAEVGQYPKVQEIVQDIPILASKDANYLSNEQKNQAVAMRAAYVDFYYNGDNDWKVDHSDVTYPYIRCKPMQPQWSHDEDTLIGLFLKAGWKFKKSWTCGLQYALLHRAESATSGRWYQLRKEKSYMIKDVGRGMNQDAMIVRAKRTCKKMMQSTLSKGPPQPRPKPKSYEELRKLPEEDYEREMMHNAHRRNGEEFEFN